MKKKQHKSPALKKLKKEVLKHVKEDVRHMEKEEHRDKKLLKKVRKVSKPSKKKTSKPKESAKAKSKIQKVMHEFKEGALHSGSKKGPVVSNPKQAIAISLSEAKKRGYKVPKKKK